MKSSQPNWYQDAVFSTYANLKVSSTAYIRAKVETVKLLQNGPSSYHLLIWLPNLKGSFSRIFCLIFTMSSYLLLFFGFDTMSSITVCKYLAKDWIWRTEDRKRAEEIGRSEDWKIRRSEDRKIQRSEDPKTQRSEDPKFGRSEDPRFYFIFEHFICTVRSFWAKLYNFINQILKNCSKVLNYF